MLACCVLRAASEDARIRGVGVHQQPGAVDIEVVRMARHVEQDVADLVSQREAAKVLRRL
jgi:hypothetical protein